MLPFPFRIHDCFRPLRRDLESGALLANEFKIVPTPQTPRPIMQQPPIIIQQPPQQIMSAAPKTAPPAPEILQQQQQKNYSQELEIQQLQYQYVHPLSPRFPDLSPSSGFFNSRCNCRHQVFNLFKSINSNFKFNSKQII